MSDLQELTDELMQDPEFVKEFEAIQPEVNITRAICKLYRMNGLRHGEFSINHADRYANAIRQIVKTG